MHNVNKIPLDGIEEEVCKIKITERDNYYSDAKTFDNENTQENSKEKKMTDEDRLRLIEEEIVIFDMIEDEDKSVED